MEVAKSNRAVVRHNGRIWKARREGVGEHLLYFSVLFLLVKGNTEEKHGNMIIICWLLQKAKRLVCKEIYGFRWSLYVNLQPVSVTVISFKCTLSVLHRRKILLTRTVKCIAVKCIDVDLWFRFVTMCNLNRAIILLKVVVFYSIHAGFVPNRRWIVSIGFIEIKLFYHKKLLGLLQTFVYDKSAELMLFTLLKL